MYERITITWALIKDHKIGSFFVFVLSLLVTDVILQFLLDGLRAATDRATKWFDRFEVFLKLLFDSVPGEIFLFGFILFFIYLMSNRLGAAHRKNLEELNRELAELEKQKEIIIGLKADLNLSVLSALEPVRMLNEVNELRRLVGVIQQMLQDSLEKYDPKRETQIFSLVRADIAAIHQMLVGKISSPDQHVAEGWGAPCEGDVVIENDTHKRMFRQLNVEANDLVYRIKMKIAELEKDIAEKSFRSVDEINPA